MAIEEHIDIGRYIRIADKLGLLLDD